MYLISKNQKWNWKEKITIRTANALLAVKRGFLLRANLPTNRNLARMSRAWVRILSVWNMHDFSIFDKEGTVGRKAEETLGYFQPFFTTAAVRCCWAYPHTRNADLHSLTNSSSVLPPATGTFSLCATKCNLQDFICNTLLKVEM